MSGGPDGEATRVDIDELAHAADIRLGPFIRRTPLEPSPDLERVNAGRVFLKLENVQHTGSFKVRGALNRLLVLDDDQRRAGVITASSGNHGLAVAFGMRRLGVDGIIYLPENASRLKVRLLEGMGATIRFYGADCDGTEAHARRQAQATGRTYVSPYNDPWVVGGQGTIALEILGRLPRVDVVMASVGGGGLIAGIAGTIKAIRPTVSVVGCLPAHSPAMVHCVKAGRVVAVDGRETLSDGTAGGIEPDAITVEPCRALVDDWVLVTEDEIRRAMRWVFDHHRLVVEGAAAVTVAAFLKTAHRLTGQTVVLVICGGNIDVRRFKRIVCDHGDGAAD